MGSSSQFTQPSDDNGRDYLDGQLLIAMPGLADPNFEHAVIYLCAHSEQGAVGLIINRRANMLTFEELIDQLDIKAPRPLPSPPIFFGGPVETDRGFVLHSTDYASEDSTLRTSPTIGLTATRDILRAMALGDGPEKTLLAIGYAGWAPGQLETEIQANGWLTSEADESIIFDPFDERKWDRAIAKLGIDVSLLSSDFGHA